MMPPPSSLCPNVARAELTYSFPLLAFSLSMLPSHLKQRVASKPAGTTPLHGGKVVMDNSLGLVCEE